MRHSHLLRVTHRRLATLLVVVLAVAIGVVATPGAAAAANLFSFSAGILQPGQVKHVWWNNADADAWAASLQVTRVEPFQACIVTLERTWYEREASGEREFHLQIRGDSRSSCQVTVWLTPFSMFRQSSTGVLAPGAKWSAHWNNAHAEQYVYAVGVLGSQPSSGTCRIEVATHYRTQPDGENEFYYTATNIGSIACSAELRHVRLPVESSHALGQLSAGSSTSVSPNLFDPNAKVFIPGVLPGANPSGTCRYDISPAGVRREPLLHPVHQQQLGDLRADLDGHRAVAAVRRCRHDGVVTFAGVHSRTGFLDAASQFLAAWPQADADACRR